MKNKSFTYTLIQKHEGLRFKPYRCTAGKLTIGFGRNLENKGISCKEAMYLLDTDIKECIADLYRIFPICYSKLSAYQQAGLISMRYQLGHTGFRKFKKMIAAIRNNDMDLAEKEALDSKWAKEDTPERAKEVAQLIGGK